MITKVNYRLLMLLLALLLLAPTSFALQQNELRGQKPEKPPIRLVLTASQTRVRVNRTFELVAFLENMTHDRAFYVGGHFSFGIISSYQNVLLTIIDEKGREVVYPRMSATSIWEVDKLTTEEVEQSYVKLSPGMIFGRRSEDDFGLGPGRYRIIATYRDDFAQVWLKNKNISLRFPVWRDSITSNPVTVRVVR